MNNSKIEEVLYSERALQNALSIKHYLIHHFSDKEVNIFFSLLQSFEAVILKFPKLYAATSSKNNIRRAVLSKQLSVFYRINKSNIEVLAMLDNRCDISEWS
jgi:plasmid stabilization system protein ParE